MLSRLFAILFASFLPTAALILPFGSAHRVNAIVAGTLATILAGLAMASDRARFGAVAIGGWVALTAFIFPSTLLEEVVVVCWGTMMFVSLAGPLSEPPRRSWTAAALLVQAHVPAQEQLPVREPATGRARTLAA